ncbi:MAG: MetQ/NlpA family ABC transporter substrate-binding protein [Thermacetogeniaceae bacterium]
MKRAVALMVTLGVLVLMLLLPTGCKKQTSLKVGILYDEEALPAYVAQQEGLFQKNGVDVQLLPFRSAAERDSAIQSGGVDGAEGDLIAVALLNNGGFPVKAVSVALGAKPEEGRFYILAAPNTFNKVEEIKGKTIAISKNTIIDFLADQMLSAKGINPDQVQKEYIPNMPMRLQMLLDHKVDAALLPDPLASMAIVKGAAVLVDKSKLPVILSQSVLFFRDDALKTKSSATKGFLQAYGQAEQEIDKNPDSYRQLFYEKINVPKEVQSSIPVPSFSPEQLPSQENVQLVLDWMIKKKLLSKNLSYSDLVSDQLVSAK